MTRKQSAVLAVFAIAAFALAFLASQRVFFRLDLTKNKAYTLSEVSRNLYTEIPDQVRITYFISDKLASIHPMPGEITDLLREYAAHSHGRIQVAIRDPVKADLVEAVESLGIQGQQIETVERDQASLVTVYTGILIEYLDMMEVLPAVFSLDTLEYDLTSRIRSMLRGTVREAGILIGDAQRQWAQDYAYLDRTMTSSGYKLRIIVPTDIIPPSLPMLLVLGGVEDMDGWDLYRIDHYIQNGGKVFFAVETAAVDMQYGAGARLLEDKGLLAMLSSYGAEVKPSLVLDRASLTLPFQSAGPGGQAQIRFIQYPFFISVLNQFGNPQHPITSGFGGVDLFWASPIELAPPGGVEAATLFTTTPEAWLQTQNFSVNPDQSYSFSMEEEETRGTRIMGAALTGKFPSWFRGRPKPVREGMDSELPDMSGEAKDARIVVIGDTDFGSAYIQYTRSQQNLDFFVKVLDWLGNDDDIIGIRSREASAGRLDKITDTEKRLGAMAFARFLNLVFIPLIVIVSGLLIALRRRRASGVRAGTANQPENQGEV
ncbi:MAG: GldG family protein [Spirochaetaceae bacterium]|jgi:gliding-associated putative ABC transporter substrate-binding component GldG|nr:GldG family protein [Spirochaetaceae bacterium]